jgi:hypothetical protein
MIARHRRSRPHSGPTADPDGKRSVAVTREELASLAGAVADSADRAA